MNKVCNIGELRVATIEEKYGDVLKRICLEGKTPITKLMDVAITDSVNYVKAHTE